MVKIGIVARSAFDEEGKECFLLRESGLRRAVIDAGGCPILLVPLDDVDKNVEVLDLCDGFILPGGDEWTSLDLLVIDYALECKKPILGICLGMQLMGMDRNCLELKELNSDFHLQDDRYVHNVVIKEESLLYSILNKKEVMVNSRHRHTIDVCDKFDIVGMCDEVVEAIEFPDHPFFLGVQWHPEDMTLYDGDAKKIFNSLIRACQK